MDKYIVLNCITKPAICVNICLRNAKYIEGVLCLLIQTNP